MIIPEVWYFQLLKKDYKKFDLFNRIDDFVTDKQLTTQEEINNKTFFSIPFIPKLSNKISNFLKHVPFIRMAYKSINKSINLSKSKKMCYLNLLNLM